MSGIVILILRILLAIALYAFLGWVLITIWNDLRQQGYVLTHNKIPTLVLTGMDSTSQEYQFAQPVITIGRSPTNDLAILNETVSSYHTRLHYYLNQWWVNDLNSTNGTFLNGQQIATSTVLTSGDMLTCGETNFLIAIGEN
jgi:pSer/pThr/pTyr-binding forkhead associated (FHA) protein